MIRRAVISWSSTVALCNNGGNVNGGDMLVCVHWCSDVDNRVGVAVMGMVVVGAMCIYGDVVVVVVNVTLMSWWRCVVGVVVVAAVGGC